MRPISNEKREIIIDAKKRGESEKTILNWIKDISQSSITKIWKQYQTTGTHKPKPYPGSKSKLTKQQDQQIKNKIKQTPDITLNELIDELELNLTESGLSRHLKEMGLTFKKKTLHTNQQKRDGVVKERADWQELQKPWRLGSLFFLTNAVSIWL